jgi:hypothetical protein
MTKDMSKNWRLNCSVGRISFLVTSVSVTTHVGIGIMTHVCFSGFAFATTAFDTLHDNFTLGARKWKQTPLKWLILKQSQYM